MQGTADRLCVGVDGHALVNRFSGIGRFTYEMVVAMRALRPAWRIIVFAPGDVGDVEIAGVTVVPYRTTALPGSIARQVVLPGIVERSGADVFWGAAGEVPFNLQVPSVLTVHDFVFQHARWTMGWRGRIVQGIKQAASVRKATVLTALSDATARELEATGYGVKAVIGAGVRGAASCDRDGRTPTVLSVATIEPRKNLVRLVDAVEVVRRSIPAQLVLIGGQGWGGEYARLVRRGYSWVQLLGPQSDDVVTQWMAFKAGVLAMPSLYEGLGLPAFEAAALGCPVVVSRHSPMAEGLRGVASEVDPYDVESIAEGLRSALSRRGLERAKAAAPDVASKWTWRAAASRLVRVIDAALATRS